MTVYRDKQRKTLNITIDELDLEAESSRPGAPQPAARRKTPATGFGMTLGNLTPDIAQRLELPSGTTGAVITDVERNSAARAGLRAGDVILKVNRGGRRVGRRRQRELQKCGRARRHSCWSGGGTRKSSSRSQGVASVRRHPEGLRLSLTPSPRALSA